MSWSSPPIVSASDRSSHVIAWANAGTAFAPTASTSASYSSWWLSAALTTFSSARTASTVVATNVASTSRAMSSSGTRRARPTVNGASTASGLVMGRDEGEVDPPAGQCPQRQQRLETRYAASRNHDAKGSARRHRRRLLSDVPRRRVLRTRRPVG
jgi:hypothetical protein